LRVWMSLISTGGTGGGLYTTYNDTYSGGHCRRWTSNYNHSNGFILHDNTHWRELSGPPKDRRRKAQSPCADPEEFGSHYEHAVFLRPQCGSGYRCQYSRGTPRSYGSDGTGRRWLPSSSAYGEGCAAAVQTPLSSPYEYPGKRDERMCPPPMECGYGTEEEGLQENQWEDKEEEQHEATFEDELQEEEEEETEPSADDEAGSQEAVLPGRPYTAQPLPLQASPRLKTAEPRWRTPPHTARANCEPADVPPTPARHIHSSHAARGHSYPSGSRSARAVPRLATTQAYLAQTLPQRCNSMPLTPNCADAVQVRIQAPTPVGSVPTMERDRTLLLQECTQTIPRFPKSTLIARPWLRPPGASRGATSNIFRRG